MVERRTLATLTLLVLIGCAAPQGRPADLARPHFDAGIKAYEAGEYLKAINAFNEAVRLYPDHADAWFRKGSARMHRVAKGEISNEAEELARADEDLTRALAIIPIYYQARYNRGLTRAALGRYREAAEDLQESLQSPEPGLKRDAHLKLARLFDGKFEDMQARAIAHFEKYFEFGGRDSGARERLALLRGADAEASRSAEREVEANALFVQALQLAEGGDRKGAIGLLEKAIAMEALPADKRKFAAATFAQLNLQERAEAAAEVLFGEAQGLIREGNRKLAVDILKRAAGKYPTTDVVSQKVRPLLEKLGE